MCLNGTHPYLLADFKPFQIVLVKLAVSIVLGQCYESTSRAGLSWAGETSRKSADYADRRPCFQIFARFGMAGQNSFRYG